MNQYKNTEELPEHTNESESEPKASSEWNAILELFPRPFNSIAARDKLFGSGLPRPPIPYKKLI
jgi:hypothetical protein